MLWGRLGDVSFESKVVIAVVSGSEFINHTYLVLFPPIMGLLAEDFQVSLTLLGIALGARAAATVLFQLPFGYLSDRYDRAIGMWLSLALGGAGTLVAAISPTFVVLAASQVLIGIGTAGHHPSHFPLLSEAVPADYRARVFSVRGFTGSLGFAAPPVVILAILSLPGTSWRHAFGVLGAVGLLYCLVAVVVIRRYVSHDVRRPDRSEAQQMIDGSSVIERIRGEIRSLVSLPTVLALGVFMIIVMTVASGFRTYLVVHLTDGYGLGLSAANLTLTVMFAVAAFLRLGGGFIADRLPAGTVVSVAFGLLGLFMFLIASMIVPAFLAVALAIGIGGMRSASAPATEKLFDRFSTPTTLGQSFAVMTIGMMIGTTIGPGLFGFLIDTAGLRIAFLTMAGLTAVAVLLFLSIITVYDEDFSIRRPMKN